MAENENNTTESPPLTPENIPSNPETVEDRVVLKDDRENLDFILDVPLEITIELGRTHMLIQDLLKLGQGSVIELVKQAGDTLDILANQRLIARGEVVVVKDKYGIRLTEVISPEERIQRLR